MKQKHTMEKLNKLSHDEWITIILSMQGQLDALNENIEKLIEQADHMSTHQIETFGEKAKERIRTAYSWRAITDRYEEIFMKRDC